jgi:hypothetical protein
LEIAARLAYARRIVTKFGQEVDDGRRREGPGREEMAALREQLADARAEVERLQRDAASAAAEATYLRDDVRASHDEAATAVAEAATLREQIVAATERAQAAAERYRDLVVRTDPALPADLIRRRRRCDRRLGDGSSRDRRACALAHRDAGAGQAGAGRRAAAFGAGPERADAGADDPPRPGPAEREQGSEDNGRYRGARWRALAASVQVLGSRF